jgi:hypothetical protein|tara:strand:+ start:103 stop:435 length:333 start_codon:yes stop_codon:yes gene_type:complete
MKSNKIKDINPVSISHYSNKRKAIIKPINVDPPLECSCSICKNNKLNASGLCCLCSRVICNEHTYTVNEKKYCLICRNDSEYRPVITASSQYLNNKSKWYCCVKNYFKKI